jgi:hypothetical protein
VQVTESMGAPGGVEPPTNGLGNTLPRYKSPVFMLVTKGTCTYPVHIDIIAFGGYPNAKGPNRKTRKLLAAAILRARA